MRPAKFGLIASLAAVIALTASAGVPVAASISQPVVVSDDPVNVTPNVVSDSVAPSAAVLALARQADTIYAGGSIHTVTNASNTQSFVRHNIMAFNATTGALKSFAPTLNGRVWAVRVKGPAVYVGGDFTTVNGKARNGLVKLDAKTGAIKTKFKPPVQSGNVTEIKFVGKRLLVGGSFPGKLAALNPRTGAATNYVAPTISGRVADNSGPTKVYRFAVNPARTRLVAVGNFTSVGGQDRRQAFMLRLGDKRATVSDWYYEPLNNSCSAAQTPFYMRDVDFSPDGSYFVLVSTGYIPQAGGVGRDLCDAAARFETANTSPSEPTWINYTGGDTLHSVAVTGAAVYVQGHQRWLDNPSGNDNAGPGAVEREGIGAIDPVSGMALSWNPGKTRGVGGKDFMATPDGLWVGSDGDHFAGEFRAGIAFLPLP